MTVASRRTMRGLGGAVGLLALGVGGCDFSGDFLFSEVNGIPSIYEITSQEGGALVPAVLEGNTTEDDTLARQSAQLATIYGEMAPPSTTAEGGFTFTFLGTGSDVCVWVDPEVTSWSTVVSSNPSDDERRWTYPDNIFDDGDIDIFAGLSVYYTGSPRGIGDFEVAYEDSLGNDIGIELSDCPDTLSDSGRAFAHSGKGLPEWCTINTDGFEGVSYTVLLRNFSTPLDDSRLAFGLLVAEGDCQTVYDAVALGRVDGEGGGLDSIDPVQAECLIRGESLEPIPREEGSEDSYVPFYGFEAASVARWPRSMQFEDQFCSALEPLNRWCRREADAVADSGNLCSWENFDAADYSVDEKCYCGDPEDLPDPEAF